MATDGDLLRSLSTPVVQAGMGFVAGHELAAAVSEAGGLGMIAASATPLAEELAAARRLTDRPIAVNLLLPFARPADFEAAAAADAIVTFWATRSGRQRASGCINAVPSRRPGRRPRQAPTRS